MLLNMSSSLLARLCALCGRIVVVIMWGAACREPVAHATSHIRTAFASIGKWRWLKTLKQREAGERTCGHMKGCDAAFVCVCMLTQAVAASSSSATCILSVHVVIVAARGLYGHVHVTVRRLCGCVGTVGYTILSARIVVCLNAWRVSCLHA